MAGIRARNTKPEMRVRRALHAAGLRFRLHRRDVPGSPDILLPRYRTAVFIHGCYWHGHSCLLFRLPASNVDFWRRKIEANRKRDQVVAEQLRAAKWRRLVIWECSFRGTGQIGEAAALEEALAFIRGDAPDCEIRGVR